MRHLIFWFLIQKRGSRKGSIEIKKIRCVEKVNLEEQTPAERQYPFQVRGGTTFYCKLHILAITKDVAKWQGRWPDLDHPQMVVGHFAEIWSTDLLSLEGEKERGASKPQWHNLRWGPTVFHMKGCWAFPRGSKVPDTPEGIKRQPHPQGICRSLQCGGVKVSWDEGMPRSLGSSGKGKLHTSLSYWKKAGGFLGRCFKFISQKHGRLKRPQASEAPRAPNLTACTAGTIGNTLNSLSKSVSSFAKWA